MVGYVGYTPNLSPLSNITTNPNNSHLSSPGCSNKPEVILEIITDDGKELEFEALIDPGSRSVDKSSNNNDGGVVSYIIESLATITKK